MTPSPEAGMGGLREELASASFRLQWLEREVGILEDKIKFFDDLSFKIKSWAIATWSALVSFALTQRDWRVGVLSCLVPVLFLWIDASYKRYQMVFIQRTRDVMRLLNDPSVLAKEGLPATYSFPVYDLLGIYGRGRRETALDRQWGPIVQMVTKGSVGLIYWALILISLGIIVRLLVATGP